MEERALVRGLRKVGLVRCPVRLCPSAAAPVAMLRMSAIPSVLATGILPFVALRIVAEQPENMGALLAVSVMLMVLGVVMTWSILRFANKLESGYESAARIGAVIAVANETGFFRKKFGDKVVRDPDQILEAVLEAALDPEIQKKAQILFEGELVAK